MSIAKKMIDLQQNKFRNTWIVKSHKNPAFIPNQDLSSLFMKTFSQLMSQMLSDRLAL